MKPKTKRRPFGFLSSVLPTLLAVLGPLVLFAPRASAEAEPNAQKSGGFEAPRTNPTSAMEEANGAIDPWKDTLAWRAKWGAKPPLEGDSASTAPLPLEDPPSTLLPQERAAAGVSPWNVSGTRPLPTPRAGVAAASSEPLVSFENVFAGRARHYLAATSRDSRRDRTEIIMISKKAIMCSAFLSKITFNRR